MENTVLVLGASGKIGRHAVEAFERDGWRVRCYDRRQADMISAAQGASVIVNGLNPPAYHDWARLVPAITRQVIEAAQANDAMVIVPGNVYNFGDRGGVWSESTPQAATTRKGIIRRQMEEDYRASGAHTLILRAGNFIDPHRNADVMSLLLMREIEKGKLTYAGDPHVSQAYCYVPDWARAAVQLANMRHQLDRFEDVPFPGHSFSVEELQRVLCKALQRPIELKSFPWWLMSALAPFWELAREMLEMRYLWSTPHSLSGAKFAQLLPAFEATPLREVMLAGLPPNLRPLPAAAAPALEPAASRGSSVAARPAIR